MSKNEVTIEDLAQMVQSGFTGIQDQMDKRFEKVEHQIDDMRKENNTRFESLEQGQLDIKLRLDNVAHRFELRQLEKRVDVLEQKAKFA